MSYATEKDWMTPSGLRAVAIRLDNRGTPWHRCAYVGVPVGHPLHGVGYSETSPALAPPGDDAAIGSRGIIPLILAAAAPERMRTPEVVFDVHGSITYAASNPGYPAEHDGLWWFGFDCGHAGDDEDGGKSLEYVIWHCESLAAQLSAIKVPA